MKLIADSGSTKTAWVILDKTGVKKEFLTQGFNPYYQTKGQIKETLESGESRVVLKLPAVLSPNKVAILPLLKKDGLPEKAKEIMNELKFDFKCVYDEKDSIGKRYRRQDAVGTPFCVTIDHQTLEDNTVTVRNRDDMSQQRMNISELHSVINEKVNMKNLFKKIVG